MQNSTAQNNSNKKYTLVTGGTGFIGSHLVERLLEQGQKVKVLALPEPFESIEKENLEIIKQKGAKIVYGDITKPETLPSAMQNVDTIYHLAAISRPMKITTQKYYEVNEQGTKNILEAAHKQLGENLKKFIHVSTVSVLGTSPDGHPLKEDEFQKNDQHYGQSKKTGELAALEYYKQHKMPLVVIRPCLVYGPRCVVRLIMFKYVKMGLFPMFGGGKAKIEFVYVDNLVDAILAAGQSANDTILGEVFNITDGQAYSMKQILTTIAKHTNAKTPRLNIPTWLGVFLGWAAEVFSKIVGIHPPFSRETAQWMSKDVNVYDCSKAKKVLGYNPKVSLDQGIKKSVEWYKDKNLL